MPSYSCASNIRFVISKNKDVSINPIAIEKFGNWCHFHEVHNCSKKEMRKIISARLKSEHKQIGESVMQALLDHPLINNMICMELILQNILNLDHRDFIEIHKLEESLGGNDAISQYLCNIIKEHPKNETNLIIHWMDRSLKLLAEHNNDEFHYLYYTVACMTLSMNGLSTAELSDMAEYIRTSGRAGGNYWLNWWEEVRFSKLRKSVRKLRHKKLIKDYYDLESILKIRYLSLKAYTGFLQSDKNKQMYVDEMWTYYCDSYEIREFFDNKDTRDELLSITMYLMEFLLSGYMPAKYVNEGSTIGQFASYLLRREGVYMEAVGYTYNFTKNIYIIYLLRAMFLLDFKETDPVRFKEECRASQNTLCCFLDLWGNKPDKYLLKCRKLCNWHEEYLT